MSTPRVRPLLGVVGLVAVCLLTGCGGGSGKASDSDSPSTGSSGSGGGSVTCSYPPDGFKPSKDVTPPPATPTVIGQVTAKVDTSVGPFTFTLDADKAPCTVNSFVSLAKQGYFDDTPCPRLTLPDTTGIAVLQCGDPTGSGAGTPGYLFEDELTGKETYGPGTLAMANRGTNTNGSQFFIVYAQTPLPPSYTVFGKVDAATLQAVEKVAAAGTDNGNGQGDGHPTTPVTITKVTIS